MNYKFAVEDRSYEDYSSGRVFFNQKGTTSFPVRLASEIYQRCAAILLEQGCNKPYVLYDPCCGGAYLLTSLGYLHGEGISKIFASDIDETVIQLAHKNLSLLSHEGLDERIKQIEKMIADYGKESHTEAQHSALILKSILEKQGRQIEAKCFAADIISDTDLIGNTVNGVNILITDLPYGNIACWNSIKSGIQNEEEATEKLLDNIFPAMAKDSVISIISTKRAKIRHDKYKRLERFVIGKRQVTILQPIFKASIISYKIG